MKAGWNATRTAARASVWGAFLLVAVWGIVPLAGGRTLCEILAQMGGLSLTGAAAVISCVVAVLGALSLAFTGIMVGSRLRPVESATVKIVSARAGGDTLRKTAAVRRAC